MNYFPRRVEKRLSEALRTFPVCLITGPRQAGKSTLLQQCLPGFHYVSLDDPIFRQAAAQDPALFLDTQKRPLIIDEIQYVPQLFNYIKLEVDKTRHQYGQFVLTGSQVFPLMQGVSESLAGRIAIFELYPFSWPELPLTLERQDELQMAAQMVQGFYPEFLVNPYLLSSLWYGSYLNTYVERDVRNIRAIGDLVRFQTFLGLLAARAGQLINYSEIAKECGITVPTVKDWLSLLEATYIIKRLKPYHKNLSKRLVKSPKLYFVDTGFLCYLLGIDSAERFFKCSERGAIFENMMIMEALKHLAYEPFRSESYFYRTSNGTEVDLIIEAKQRLYAYEIKLSKTPTRHMAKSLELFAKEHPVCTLHLLSLYQNTVSLSKGVLTRHWSSPGWPT